MSDSLVFRWTDWTDPGADVLQVRYPDGVTAAEVLGDLVRVYDEWRNAVWQGRIEDYPGGGN